MKNLYFIAAFAFLLCGCNMGPSKEARIQALELETAHTKDQIEKMEIRLRKIEAQNEELRTLILESQFEPNF